MFILDTGYVKIYVNSGSHTQIFVKYPPTVFGEVALFKKCERMADVQAGTFCVMYMLTRHSLDEIIKQSKPDIADRILFSMAFKNIYNEQTLKSLRK